MENIKQELLDRFESYKVNGASIGDLLKLAKEMESEGMDAVVVRKVANSLIEMNEDFIEVLKPIYEDFSDEQFRIVQVLNANNVNFTIKKVFNSDGRIDYEFVIGGVK